MGRSCKVYYLLTIPYDGGQIGSFKGDAIRNISGVINTTGGVFNRDMQAGALFTVGSSKVFLSDSSGVSYSTYLQFEASRVVPTDVDNHPAQMAVAKYIHY